MRSPITSLLLIVSLSTTALERVAHAGGADEPDKKLKVVVFGGHPDDPESGAGGLIATLTRQGHEVICRLRHGLPGRSAVLRPARGRGPA